MPRRKPKRVNGKPFKKGYDPRRHKFTPEEYNRGYENAKLVLLGKYPDARCQHGAHISHCLLRVKNPLWFEVRRLQGKVRNLEQRLGKHNEKVRGLKRELRQLQQTKGFTYRDPQPKQEVLH